MSLASPKAAVPTVVLQHLSGTGLVPVRRDQLLCVWERHRKYWGGLRGRSNKPFIFRQNSSDVSLFRNHIQMLKLNIWASPLCFVFVPQAWCSLWNHLLRSYHLVHQPPLTSGRGSAFPLMCWEGLGKVTIAEPPCWPHQPAPAPPHGLLCCNVNPIPHHYSNVSQASAPQAPSLGSRECGSMVTKTWKQPFHVLDEMRAFPRRAEGLAEGLHSPWESGWQL